LFYRIGSRFLLFIILVGALVLQLKVQQAEALWPPEAEWIRTYALNQDPLHRGRCVSQTPDGGYLVFGDGGKGTFTSGLDYFLMKTDASGNMQWYKTYKIYPDESLRARKLLSATDGGYIMLGGTWDIPVSVLMKADSNGTLLWNCTYSDFGVSCICQTSDGGYAIAGSTYGGDFWLGKTDSNGTIQWETSFGGSGSDYGVDVKQSSDGGFYVVGDTTSFGAGDQDAWLVKTDSNGVMQWNKTYGEAFWDEARGLILTEDGKLTIFGATYSYGAEDLDAWLVRTDALGNEEWNKIYGTENRECYPYAVETSDGGYVLSGVTFDWWPEPGVNLGAFLFKIDYLGNLQWSGWYEGVPLRPTLSCVLEAEDGGYVMAGELLLAHLVEEVLLIKTYPPNRHDVAVTGVSASKAIVGQNLTAILNVTVENQGQYAETFGVRVYANDTLIGSETLVDFDSEIQLQFAWDTTGFMLGTYNVSATIDAVAGETDLQDNTRSGCMVEVRSPRHDVGVFDVTAYPALVLNGSELNVDLTASNLGDYSEAFNVTVLANETAIARREVSLPELQSTPLAVAWNTSGFELGNYTLSATADAVPEEVNLSDNLCTDGQVTVRGPGDVAVLQARTAKKDCLPAPTLGQGFTVRVTAEAQNQSPWHETFNVSLFFQENILETQQVELLGGESRILEFTWDATAVPYGNQSVTVRADAVVAETEVGDNVFESDQVLVTIPGDVNGDHYVNAKDAVLLGTAFYPAGTYNPNADINDDGYCNAKDAVILGTYFGQNWP